MTPYPARGFISLPIILAILAGIAVLGGGAWWFTNQNNVSDNSVKIHILSLEMGKSRLPLIHYSITGTSTSTNMYLNFVGESGKGFGMGGGIEGVTQGENVYDPNILSNPDGSDIVVPPGTYVLTLDDFHSGMFIAQSAPFTLVQNTADQSSPTTSAASNSVTSSGAPTFKVPGTVTLSVGQTAINNYGIDGNTQYDSLKLDKIEGGYAHFTYAMNSLDCGLNCGNPPRMMYATTTVILSQRSTTCTGWPNSDNGELVTLTSLSSGQATLSFQFASAGTKSQCKEKGADSAMVVRSGSVEMFPGMTKYTDGDFGFSFWYPSGWNIATTPTDYSRAVPTRVIRIGVNPQSEESSDLRKDIFVSEYYASDGKITDSDAKGYNFVEYWFNAGIHTWEVNHNGHTGEQWEAADVSKNTMGGLHLLAGVQWPWILPLSAHAFVLVQGGENGTPAPLSLPLAKTIIATDPSVATPVSAAEQIATIKAEQAAYAGN